MFIILGDDFAKFLITYAEKETFNSSTKEALINFAGNLSAVQDYRDSEVCIFITIIFTLDRRTYRVLKCINTFDEYLGDAYLHAYP